MTKHSRPSTKALVESMYLTLNVSFNSTMGRRKDSRRPTKVTLDIFRDRVSDEVLNFLRLEQSRRVVDFQEQFPLGGAILSPLDLTPPKENGHGL